MSRPRTRLQSLRSRGRTAASSCSAVKGSAKVGTSGGRPSGVPSGESTFFTYRMGSVGIFPRTWRINWGPFSPGMLVLVTRRSISRRPLPAPAPRAHRRPGTRNDLLFEAFQQSCPEAGDCDRRTRYAPPRGGVRGVAMWTFGPGENGRKWQSEGGNLYIEDTAWDSRPTGGWHSKQRRGAVLAAPLKLDTLWTSSRRVASRSAHRAGRCGTPRMPRIRPGARG